MTKGKVALLASAIACVCLSASLLAWRVGSISESVAAADARRADAEAAVSEVSAVVGDSVEDASAASFDYDRQRLANDSERLEELAKTASDWADGEAYGLARQALADAGVAEDSQLLTVFMPPLEVQGTSGETDVDLQGLHSTFVDADVSLVGVRDDVYSYVVEVTCTTTDTRGADATGSFLLWSDVALDGSLSSTGASAIA